MGRQKTLTASKIARRLGKDPSHLYKVLKGTRGMSIEYAMEIEAAAGGAAGFRVEDLIPGLARLLEQRAAAQ